MDRRQFLKVGAVGAAAFGGVNLFAIGRSQAAATINLYTARHYDTDEVLYTEFTRQTGIAINRVDAGAEKLVERMQAEGANSPADVFVTVDAGRIEAAKQMGLLQPVNSSAVSAAVPAHLRDPDGYWFGMSKRARVILYDKSRVKPGDIATYEDLADPKWKGKLLIRSSTNIYNLSLTGSILAAAGAEKTEAWARGIATNLARPPRGGDTDQIKAVAAGEGEICVVNTYYLGNLIRSSKPEERAIAEKIGVVFPNQADRGTHVNIAGGGIAKHAKNVEGARLFLEYLVGGFAQRVFAESNSEYPVVAGIEVPSSILPFGQFKEDQLNAGIFAKNNAEALKIMDRAGWK
jgi:iron(III) transport system substrate-binding protein